MSKRNTSSRPSPTPTLAHPLPFPAPLRTRFPPAQLLDLFRCLIDPPALALWMPGHPRAFYQRLFSPLVTLWYLVFQRLHPDPTLEAVVTDVHDGGADVLAPARRPLSARIRSWATTAYSNARQRLPLRVLREALATQSRQIQTWVKNVQWRELLVTLLDGSTVRLRPLGDIPEHFPPQGRGKKQTQKRYWCFMRVVVSFCVRSGVALGCAVGAVSVSEQALATQIILGAAPGTLFIGDRNFGVFRMAQAVQHAGAQMLVRLTHVRARKLAGQALQVGREYWVRWSPSRQDQQEPGCSSDPVPGRLIVHRIHRQGFRPEVLYLFTTLVEATLYPTAELVALYGGRWRIELNLRYLKTQMALAQLSSKSADMAQKEWYAGLVAYNLIRGVMLCAAVQAGVEPQLLSFSAARRQVTRWLENYGSGRQVPLESWQKLLAGVGRRRQPKRKKARPSEPRAKRPVRESFPALWGSRANARRQIKKYASK